MKTVKKFLFVIVMAAMLLSACGRQPQQPAARRTRRNPLRNQPAASDPESNLYFGRCGTNLNQQAQVLTKLMDSFTAQHPNITFSVVWNGRENQTKLRTALSAGTMVDFMDQDSDQLAGGMMSEGLGYPLDEWLTQKALDQDVPVTDIFSPGVLDAIQGLRWQNLRMAVDYQPGHVLVQQGYPYQSRRLKTTRDLG